MEYVIANHISYITLKKSCIMFWSLISLDLRVKRITPRKSLDEVWLALSFFPLQWTSSVREIEKNEFKNIELEYYTYIYELKYYISKMATPQALQKSCPSSQAKEARQPPLQLVRPPSIVEGGHRDKHCKKKPLIICQVVEIILRCLILCPCYFLRFFQTMNV